jgi:hypothetical protein
MITTHLKPLWTTILVCALCLPSLLAAAPKPADDDDVPVAEGPADASARPKDEAAPGDGDDELLRAIEAKKAAEEEIDRLERAIAGMRNAQKRIDASDTSSQTQKIQEQVVKDLEELLALLKKQLSRQSSSQQSSSQRPDNQKNQRQKMEKGRNDPQNSDTQGSRRNDDKSGESQERTDAARAKAAEDARRAQMIKDVWGHLPPHLREAIRNALRDNYLPKYDDLVKKYYEALAEKNRKRAAK